MQQAFGKYLVFSGEYVWKYTHNAYDFSVLGSTPITFPIEWHNSKIPAICGTGERAQLPWILGAVGVLQRGGALFNPQIGAPARFRRERCNAVHRVSH